MAGPIAPKDPTKKREGFYILHEKDICGLEQPDGSGVHHIYLDMGRLLTFAKIVGQIEDEEMMECLKTTEGFRKMVNSIGVTITGADAVDYVFQMYADGNERYTGTELKLTVPADGMERVLTFDDVDWAPRDAEPGQMRFIFKNVGDVAVASVKLYLNDGYSAPVFEEEKPIDFASEAYRSMIEKSLTSKGDNCRIKRFFEKARSGEEVTVAFIGGSITQGAGAVPLHNMCYAYQTYQNIVKMCGPDAKIRFIKAGVGGTPSELGMVRYDKDVCRNGAVTPDLVVIEFAVNDEGDETKGVCYESLVQKVLTAPNEPAVVLIFAVFADDWNLQDRLAPVGERYRLPMTSVKDAVTPEFLKQGKGDCVITRNQYFYDMFHPGNAGHTIMADCIINLLNACLEDDATTNVSDAKIEPYYGVDFYDVKAFDRSNYAGVAEINCGAFTDTDTDLQFVEMDDSPTPTPEFPDNWFHSCNGGDGFELKIKSRALLLVYKDSDSMAAGKVDVILDGKLLYTVDPRAIGWKHTNAIIVYNEKESAEHVVQIRMAAGDEDKQFSILGFGYCE